MAARQWVFQWKSAWVDNFDIPARQAQQKITTNAEPDLDVTFKNTESLLWSRESEIFLLGHFWYFLNPDLTVVLLQLERTMLLHEYWQIKFSASQIQFRSNFSDLD